ncbi:hypothetical protein ACWEN3_42065 [Streptomyces sp. NPDC004561]
MPVCQNFEVHREPVGKSVGKGTTAAVMLADDPTGDISGNQP